MFKNNYYHKIEILNNPSEWKKINIEYSYNKNFSELNWNLEGHFCINKEHFLSKFQFDTEKKDIERLIKIILLGDYPERILRLNNILDDFNKNLQNCAKELYDILYEFTYGDWYDFNSEGTCYYNAMKFLRDKFNVNPEYKN